MAVHKQGWVQSGRLFIALAVAAWASAMPMSAHAQFFGDGFPFAQPFSRPPPWRGYFRFPFFHRRAPSWSRVESFKAPPPRKLTTKPASTILVIGDSLADWLGYGLEEVYAEKPEIGVLRRVRPTFGLIRSVRHGDTPEFAQAVKEILASEQPSAIVVMLGLNDRLPLRNQVAAPAPARVEPKHQGESAKSQVNGPAQPPQPAQQAPDGKASANTPDAHAAAKPAGDAGNAPRLASGAVYDFRSGQWAELYRNRIAAMIAALKTKGVPILWVGLPAIRGPRATSDMSYLDDLYRASAEKAGIIYVNIWDGFVDENGRYAVEGPDFEGQTRRLRTSDGIHFTKFGALKLAHLVDQQLSHVMSHTALAALPSPQAAAPAKPGAARPAIGPVLPLTASGGEEAGDQLAGGSAPVPVITGATSERVLVHGDAIAAPPGRADNFAWPPPSADAHAPPQAAHAPATH